MSKFNIKEIPEIWQKLLPTEDWQQLELLDRKKQELLSAIEGKERVRGLEAYKQLLKLNQLQEMILIGLALGDGHFEKQEGGLHYRVRVEQKETSSDYVNFLYAVFKPWVLTPPSSTENRTTIRFCTISHPAFDYYGDLFYKTGIKEIPKNFGSFLTNPTLAIWFMDDGSRKGKDRTGINFNTQSFSKEQNEELLGYLAQLNMPGSLHKQNEKDASGNIRAVQYRIYLPGSSEKVLRTRVKDLILPCFAYKLPEMDYFK